ncbi:unnamed protein product [Phytophthora lilii]|uniref:Unnamed protein product n=1 Tax=Phytophthora lilii TaxID=2077276 RepID=A0A9W6WUT3_9STRA|nr:unnamed protein product [Phytophthora lilii]
MVLTIVGNPAYYNVRTNVYSNQKQWRQSVPFETNLNLRRIWMNTLPPAGTKKKESDHDSRGLQVVEIDEITYPIATVDTCDCITFPPNILEVRPCTNDVYWGVFEVKYTDGSCYDVVFDDSAVFAQCPSGLSTEVETQYVLCEVDFVNPIDRGITMADNTGVTAGVTMKNAAPSKQTTQSLRQEAGRAPKKTRIHLSVHRLLTVALEAVLALQFPWG